MNELAKHHEHVGKNYDTSDLVGHGFDYEVTRLEQGSIVEYAITARYLDRYIAGGAVVADVGVGVGHYSELLARRGCVLHLVDVAQRLLDTTVARLHAAGLAERIASVHYASATALQVLPDSCCDAVLLLGPLYHLGDAGERYRAIEEAARILHPGGLIFAAGINRITFLWDILHGEPDSIANRAEFFNRYIQDGNFDPPIEGFPPTVHMATAAEFQGGAQHRFRAGGVGRDGIVRGQTRTRVSQCLRGKPGSLAGPRGADRYDTRRPRHHGPLPLYWSGSEGVSIMLEGLTFRRYRDEDRDVVWSIFAATIAQLRFANGPWDEDMHSIPDAYPEAGGEFIIGELDGTVVAHATFLGG